MQVVAVADEARIRPNAHHDERVAAVSALEAGMPLAADADPLAVVDPAGTSTSRVRSTTRRPSPSQSPHGASSTRPRPLHSGHVCWWTNCPNTFCETRRTSPTPPQVEHSRAPVPGSDPDAAQRSHGDGDLDRHPVREARERFLQVDLDDDLEIGAAGGSMAPRRSPAEEVLAEERGEDVGEVAEMREARLEASPPEAGMTETVVQSRGARDR